MKVIHLHKLLKPCILASALAVASSATAQGSMPQPDVVVHAKLDTAQITMGGKTVLHVEVLKNDHKGVLAGIPKAEQGKVLSVGGAEVREIITDSVDLGAGRMQVNYNFVLQPFEPGVLTFPPFKYAYAQGDTAYSETVTLKVIEPEIPKEMRDSLWINPMSGTVSIPGRWYDIVPSYWPWVLIGLALAAIIVAVILLYKKNGPSLIVRKKVVPPYVLASKRLKELKSRKLAENGQAKEYYTELTDILRQYLEGRFHIYAREMTSTQILDAMRVNAETAGYTDEMKQMFEVADFVKFAKQQPLPDENVRSFSTVSNFVEATKPVEEPQDDKKSNKKTK